MTSRPQTRLSLAHVMAIHSKDGRPSSRSATSISCGLQCVRVAQAVHGSLTNEVREKVSDALQSRSLQMTWEREGIKSVTIDEGYRVSVRNRRGCPPVGVHQRGRRELGEIPVHEIREVLLASGRVRVCGRIDRDRAFQRLVSFHEADKQPYLVGRLLAEERAGLPDALG